jgi:hypothetical protein
MAEDKVIAIGDVSKLPSTGATRHTRDGIPVPKAVKLKIVQLAGDESIYLIHYDEDGNELTDTCHSSVEEALDQAEFEFSISASDWSFCGPKKE